MDPAKKEGRTVTKTFRLASGLILHALAVPHSVSAAPAARNVIAEAVATTVRDNYVFADKGKAAARLIMQKAERGYYRRLPDENAFVEALTADLFTVTADKHLRVRWSARGYPPAAATGGAIGALRAAELEAKRRTNFLVPRAELLDGNIGYLRIDGFEATADAGPTLVAAMRFLAHSDALIFDLRNNGGGDSASVALLMSYLVPPGTKLISFRDRAGRIAQSWSQAYVPGGVWSLDRPVFALTSAKTFSAAEEFAFNLQQHKRGRVIGGRSRGGANPGIIHRLGEHYRMFVPNEVAVGPVTGSNWEGTGVAPDVEVAPDAALEKAVELARVSIAPRR